MALIRGIDAGDYAPSRKTTPVAPAYSPYHLDDLFTEPIPPPAPSGLSLSLDRLGLSLAPTTLTPAPSVDTTEYAAPSQPTSQTVARTGGLGLSAYGLSKSGLPEHRGKAPYGFQDAMWNALNRANAALAAAGLGRFGITDGWRGYEQQVALKKKKPTLAATPGRSVHGIGLAADLRLTNAQYQWLLKNGSRFGLVNLPSERWHWQMMPSAWSGSFDR